MFKQLLLCYSDFFLVIKFGKLFAGLCLICAFHNLFWAAHMPRPLVGNPAFEDRAYAEIQRRRVILPKADAWRDVSIFRR